MLNKIAEQPLPPKSFVNLSSSNDRVRYWYSMFPPQDVVIVRLVQKVRKHSQSK